MVSEEKVSYGGSVAKCNVKKKKNLLYFVWKKFFHALKNTKFYQIFLCFFVLSQSRFKFRFSRSGGAFHHLATLLLYISMPSDQTFQTFSTNCQFYAIIPSLLHTKFHLLYISIVMQQCQFVAW